MTYQKTSNRQPYQKKGKKKSEIDIVLITMEQIRLGKLKPLMPDERDKLEQKYQIGKYRPYTIDLERIKQLEKETREEYSEIMRNAHSNRNYGYFDKNKSGGGKKQLEAERQKLISELENG